MSTLFGALILSFLPSQNWADDAPSAISNGLEANSQQPQESPLEGKLRTSRNRVAEFRAIVEVAEQRGLRVSLFGGSAASFIQYCKWDLDRQAKGSKIRSDRFDYAFSSIYDELQDVDLVVSRTDGNPETYEDLAYVQRRVRRVLPGLHIDVFGLHTAWNDLDGKPRVFLKDNPEFLDQHLDSHSVVLLELTEPPPNEGLIRDLKHWTDQGHYFLNILQTKGIEYLPSSRHQSTARYRQGINPPIFSVIRFLSKLFRYGYDLADSDRSLIEPIIKSFKPGQVEEGEYVYRWVQANAKKLMLFVVNLEDAWNTLEDLGLRTKLINIDPESELAILLDREPLRRRPHAKAHRINWAKARGTGRRAGDIGLKFVAHETDLFAYSAISWSVTGDVSAFISREEADNETAAHGDGFYTREGRRGIGNGGGGYHLVFKVDPDAIEGRDFILPSGDYVLWANARHLIFESAEPPEDPDVFIRYFFSPSVLRSPRQRSAFIVKLQESHELQARLWREICSNPYDSLARLWIQGGENVATLIDQLFLNFSQTAEIEEIYLKLEQTLHGEASNGELSLKSKRIIKKLVGGKNPLHEKFLKEVQDPLSPFFEAIATHLTYGIAGVLTDEEITLAEHLLKAAFIPKSPLSSHAYTRLLNKYLRSKNHLVGKQFIQSLLDSGQLSSRTRMFQALRASLPKLAEDFEDNPQKGLGRALSPGENLRLLEILTSNLQQLSELTSILQKATYKSNSFLADLETFLQAHQAKLLGLPSDQSSDLDFLSCLEAFQMPAKFTFVFANRALPLTSSPQDFAKIFSKAAANMGQGGKVKLFEAHLRHFLEMDPSYKEFQNIFLLLKIKQAGENPSNAVIKPIVESWMNSREKKALSALQNAKTPEAFLPRYREYLQWADDIAPQVEILERAAKHWEEGMGSSEFLELDIRKLRQRLGLTFESGVPLSVFREDLPLSTLNPKLAERLFSLELKEAFSWKDKNRLLLWVRKSLDSWQDHELRTFVSKLASPKFSEDQWLSFISLMKTRFNSKDFGPGHLLPKWLRSFFNETEGPSAQAKARMARLLANTPKLRRRFRQQVSGFQYARSMIRGVGLFKLGCGGILRTIVEAKRPVLRATRR